MSIDYVICDKNARALGELRQVKARTIQKPLSRVMTGSGQIQTSNIWSSQIRQLDQTIIKVYRNGALLGIGPIVPSYSKVVNATSKTISFNWASAGWWLSRLLIPGTKNASGKSYGSSTAPIDRGSIFSSILSDINLSSNSWIRSGAITPSSATWVGPWYYKNALESLSDLGSGDSSFEWELDPIEPVSDSQGTYIASWRAAAAIGSIKPEVVFQSGFGLNNVGDYAEDADFSGAMNRGYILPTGFPDNATQSVLSYSDDASAAQRGHYYEDVLQSDLVSDDMRQRLINNNVAIRRVPRQIIKFTPSVIVAGTPQYGVDYQEGDIIKFQAMEDGEITVDAFFRVYEADLTYDDESGSETVTPILVSQDA